MENGLRNAGERGMAWRGFGQWRWNNVDETEVYLEDRIAKVQCQTDCEEWESEGWRQLQVSDLGTWVRDGAFH